MVSAEDQLMHANELLAEYEQLKDSTTKIKIIEKWIQPLNKKEPCRVYVELSEGSQREVGVNKGLLRIYWDGDCKNGYANGLGREFLRLDKPTLVENYLSRYDKEGEPPQQFLVEAPATGLTMKGDFTNNRYMVLTTTTEHELDYAYDLDIDIRAGRFSEPRLIAQSSPFKTGIEYRKSYGSHFGHDFYQNLYGLGGANFEPHHKWDIVLSMSIWDKGGFTAYRYNPKTVQQSTSHQEVVDGKDTRRVTLQRAYLVRMDAIVSEIRSAAELANNAAKISDKQIKRYTSRICKKSVSVDFIDNEEYKKICPNSAYKNNLRTKTSKKLAKINNLEQIKKEDYYNKQGLNARIAQANAAESANSQNYQQNMMFNSQMQRMNTNLFINRARGY